MNDLHTHPTFRHLYEKFCTVFVDSFCDYRLNGYETRDAIVHAKGEVENLMFKKLNARNESAKLILFAYNRICVDVELTEKAIKYYKSMKKVK